MEKITSEQISNGQLWPRNKEDSMYDTPLEKRQLSPEESEIEEKRLEQIQIIFQQINIYNKKILSHLDKIDSCRWKITTLEIELNLLTRLSGPEKIEKIQNHVKSECRKCLLIESEKNKVLIEKNQLEGKVVKLTAEKTQLEGKVNELWILNNKLIQAGYIDKLTKIWNRDKFNEDAKNLIEDWAQFSIAFLDIDHFKDINDTYGHSTWDQVLRFLANKLRLIWSVYRRWWEEFLIIDTADEASLKAKLENLKNWTLWKAYSLPEFHNEKIFIKFSVGIISHKPWLTITQLTQYADDLMYQAKENRDTIITFDETIS